MKLWIGYENLIYEAEIAKYKKAVRDIHFLRIIIVDKHNTIFIWL